MTQSRDKLDHSFSTRLTSARRWTSSGTSLCVIRYRLEGDDKLYVFAHLRYGIGTIDIRAAAPGQLEAHGRAGRMGHAARRARPACAGLVGYTAG